MGPGVRMGGGIGVGGLLLVLVVSYLTGADPIQLLGGISEVRVDQVNTDARGGMHRKMMPRRRS